MAGGDDADKPAKSVGVRGATAGSMGWVDLRLSSPSRVVFLPAAKSSNAMRYQSRNLTHASDKCIFMSSSFAASQ